MWYRFSSFFIIAVFFMTAIGLFKIKDSVGNLSYQLNEVNKQVSQERNNIHMLKAEMAYLTSPERLRKLAKIYLPLDNIKPNQMIKNPLLVNNDSEQIIISTDGSLQSVKAHVRWRYKRSPGKYLKTVSTRE